MPGSGLIVGVRTGSRGRHQMHATDRTVAGVMLANLRMHRTGPDLHAIRPGLRRPRLGMPGVQPRVGVLRQTVTRNNEHDEAGQCQQDKTKLDHERVPVMTKPMKPAARAAGFLT